MINLLMLDRNTFWAGRNLLIPFRQMVSVRLRSQILPTVSRPLAIVTHASEG